MSYLKSQAARGLAMCAAIAVGAGIAMSQPASAQDVIEWRLQAHLPTGSGSWTDSVVALSAKVEERTEGRLKIRPHAADSLMAASEIFPAVRRGVIEIGYTSPAYIMDYVPTAGLAFAVPGAFEQVWEATYFWKHLGFEELVREEAAKQGVHYFTDKLYPTEMVLKQPVASLEELGSLRIRSAGMLQRFLSEVGGTTAHVPGPEIYLALSTGVVDGAHWGAAQEANSLSLYEAAKYHMRPPLGIGGVEAFIINERAMASLPDDIRKILNDTLEEHFWSRTVEYQFQEVKILTELAESQGVQVTQLPDDVQARMREVGREMREQEAQKSENAAEAVRRLNEFLEVLGR